MMKRQTDLINMILIAFTVKETKGLGKVENFFMIRETWPFNYYNNKKRALYIKTIS